MSEEHFDNSITKVAYLKIKDMVYHNELHPGEKINKRIIAEKLGFSSTPITLALKKLLGEGFIEYQNRRGFFVKKFTNKELIEFFEVRASLESLAVKLLIEQNNRSNIEEIVNYWEVHNPLILSDEEYVNADNIFHEKIVEYSNNNTLFDICTKLGYSFKSNQRGLQNSHEDSLKDHKELIEAIRVRDAETAQAIMYRHFYNAAMHVKSNFNVGLVSSL